MTTERMRERRYRVLWRFPVLWRVAWKRATWERVR